MHGIGTSQRVLCNDCPDNWEKIVVEVDDQEIFPIFVEPIRRNSKGLLGQIMRSSLLRKGRQEFRKQAWRSRPCSRTEAFLLDPVAALLPHIALDEGARVEIDHRRSSMMIRDAGFPFAGTGVNGTSGAERRGNLTKPRFARVASCSSGTASVKLVKTVQDCDGRSSIGNDDSFAFLRHAEQRRPARCARQHQNPALSSTTGFPAEFSASPCPGMPNTPAADRCSASTDDPSGASAGKSVGPLPDNIGVAGSVDGSATPVIQMVPEFNGDRVDGWDQDR